jgi:hypothetical protein
MAARRSEGTVRRLVLRETEAMVRYATEKQDKFQLTRQMLCLFVLKIVGKLRSRSGGPFLTRLWMECLEDKQRQLQKIGLQEGRREGTEDPATIVQPLWYLSVDSFFAATAAIGGALSDPTPQLLPAQEGSTDAHPWSQSIV